MTSPQIQLTLPEAGPSRDRDRSSAVPEVEDRDLLVSGMQEFVHEPAVTAADVNHRIGRGREAKNEVQRGRPWLVPAQILGRSTAVNGLPVCRRTHPTNDRATLPAS